MPVKSIKRGNQVIASMRCEENVISLAMTGVEDPSVENPNHQLYEAVQHILQSDRSFRGKAKLDAFDRYGDYPLIIRTKDAEAMNVLASYFEQVIPHLHERNFEFAETEAPQIVTRLDQDKLERAFDRALEAPEGLEKMAPIRLAGFLYDEASHPSPDLRRKTAKLLDDNKCRSGDHATQSALIDGIVKLAETFIQNEQWRAQAHEK